MSLESLLSGDTITIRSVSSTKDRSGAAVRSYTDLYVGVPAGVEDTNTSPFDFYGQRGDQRIEHRIFTQQAGIAKDYQIETSDGRNMIVTGVQKRRGRGTIPTFYVVTAEETRPGV